MHLHPPLPQLLLILLAPLLKLHGVEILVVCVRGRGLRQRGETVDGSSGVLTRNAGCTLIFEYPSRTLLGANVENGPGTLIYTAEPVPKV